MKIFHKNLTKKITDRGHGTAHIGRRSSMTPSGGRGGSNAAQHLDAVPTSTPIYIVPKHKKKIRTYPMCLSSYIDKNVTDNANQEEILVPIRIDMELEGMTSFLTVPGFLYKILPP